MPIQLTDNSLKIFTILSISVLGLFVSYKIIQPNCSSTQAKTPSSKKDDDINPFYFDPGDSDLGPILV